MILSLYVLSHLNDIRYLFFIKKQKPAKLASSSFVLFIYLFIFLNNLMCKEREKERERERERTSLIR